MRVVRAITAGVAGALAMSMAALLFAEFGIFVGLEAPAGLLLGGEAGAPETVAVGFGLHLLVGAWLALLYAEGFEAVVGAAGWCVGASFGLVHVIGAGFAMGLLPALATSSPSASAPGIFMAHQGLAGVCCFVLLHVLYGAVVGAVYDLTRDAFVIGQDASEKKKAPIPGDRTYLAPRAM